MTDTGDAAWRLVAIVALVLLLASGTPLIIAHGSALPAYARRAGWGFGVVFVVIIAGISVNVLGEAEVNNGQRVVTAGIIGPALWVAWLVYREVFREWRTARELVTWAKHLKHEDPCHTPGCRRLRAEADAILKGERRRTMGSSPTTEGDRP